MPPLPRQSPEKRRQRWKILMRAGKSICSLQGGSSCDIKDSSKARHSRLGGLWPSKSRNGCSRCQPVSPGPAAVLLSRTGSFDAYECDLGSSPPHLNDATMLNWRWQLESGMGTDWSDILEASGISSNTANSTVCGSICWACRGARKARTICESGEDKEWACGDPGRLSGVSLKSPGKTGEKKHPDTRANWSWKLT